MILGSVSCNPSAPTSPCGGKWSASINIPCVENLILSAPDESCGCDSPPYWAFSGNASKCSCCRCDPPQYECSSCISSAQYDLIYDANANNECLSTFGHTCWTDGIYIYSCHSDCLAAHSECQPP